MASSIALTTSPTLMKLLSPSIAAPVSVAAMKLLSPRLAATFSVRSLSTAIPPATGSDSNSKSGSEIPHNCSDSVSCSKSENESNGEVSELVNGFMKNGSWMPYKVMKDEEAMYARWDMPGIGIRGLKLWVEDNSLHVNGEESRRKYYGNIHIPHGCYKVEEIVAEIKNGVLDVKIPRSDIINVEVNRSTIQSTDFTDVLAFVIAGSLFLIPIINFFRL